MYPVVCAFVSIQHFVLGRSLIKIVPINSTYFVQGVNFSSVTKFCRPMANPLTYWTLFHSPRSEHKPIVKFAVSRRGIQQGHISFFPPLVSTRVSTRFYTLIARRTLCPCKNRVIIPNDTSLPLCDGRFYDPNRCPSTYLSVLSFFFFFSYSPD